jgi:hypothetical protein
LSDDKNQNSDGEKQIENVLDRQMVSENSPGNINGVASLIKTWRWWSVVFCMPDQQPKINCITDVLFFASCSVALTSEF